MDDTIEDSILPRLVWSMCHTASRLVYICQLPDKHVTASLTLNPNKLDYVHYSTCAATVLTVGSSQGALTGTCGSPVSLVGIISANGACLLPVGRYFSRRFTAAGTSEGALSWQVHRAGLPRVRRPNIASSACFAGTPSAHCLLARSTSVCCGCSGRGISTRSRLD